MSENLLRHETSPYLLQHKDNPVHWHAWRPEALAEARRLDRPILLSIGYAACHWCHVMAHESFEDPATAAVMNELFINIKVDREERPDIDHIYMAALHALGEQGGWPLTMFLAPDASPFWGGTYFPPEERYGRPAFVHVLREIARLFRDEPDRIAAARDELLAHLNAPPADDAVRLDRRLLDRATERLVALIDPENGGIRGAPKFPQASLLDLLWRSATRTGDAHYADAVRLTLARIAQGGIYDHLAGGFARYSVDAQWLVPHFEKMLYDNAQLIELLTYAWTATGEELFRCRIEETVTWLFAEMSTEEGAFASSLDADSEGEEGRFYVWQHDDVLAALTPDDGVFFAKVYDVTPAGNWEHSNILNRIATPALLSEADEKRLAELRARLLTVRAGRERPTRDDKVLADWNGLAIAALALAGAQLTRPDWIDRAARAYRFVHESMGEGGDLAHAYRTGKTIRPGFASDYGAMIKAALALYQATSAEDYLADAEAFAATLLERYRDTARGDFHLTAADAETLITRPKSVFDEALPSASALAGMGLVQLWLLTGKDIYREAVDALLSAVAPAVSNNVFGTAGLLAVLDQRLEARQVVIIAAHAEAAAPLMQTARQHLRPAMLVTRYADTAHLNAAHPAHGKTMIDGRATAYVCRGTTCSLPVTTAGELHALLA